MAQEFITRTGKGAPLSAADYDGNIAITANRTKNLSDLSDKAVARKNLGPYDSALVTSVDTLSARPLAERFADLGYITDRGVVGEGDEREALQAAFDAGGEGATFRFPTGATFTVGESISPFQGAPTGFSEPDNLFDAPDELSGPAWNVAPASAEIIANTFLAPDGSLTGARFQEGTTETVHQFRQTRGVEADTTYTVSIDARHKNVFTSEGSFSPGENRRLFVVLDTNFFTGAQSRFNLDEGTVEMVGPGATATIEDRGDGWFRCSVTGTATASGNANIDFRLHDGGGQTYQGDGESGIWVWKPLMEESSQPSPVFDETGWMGRIARQSWLGDDPWTSKIVAPNDEDRIIEIRYAGGCVFSGLYISHDFDPRGHLVGENIQQPAIRCNFTPSHDLTFFNNVFHRIARQCFFESGPSFRWKIIANRGYDLAREFWFSNRKSADHIFALNHVRNPGDDTYALNGQTRYCLVVANHTSYDGGNHHTSVTGGGPYKIHGQHNLVGANVARDVNASFVQYFNSTFFGPPTGPDGNLFASNLCKGTKLLPSREGSNALVIVRPSDAAVNYHHGNFFTGLPYIDAILNLTTTNDAEDEGGEYVFRANVWRTLRYCAFFRAPGYDRLVLKDETFLDIRGDHLFAVNTSGTIHLNEILIEGCEFRFASTSAMASVFHSANSGFSCDRLILRRNRLINDVTLDHIVDLQAGSIGQIVEEDNDWTDVS